MPAARRSARWLPPAPSGAPALSPPSRSPGPALAHHALEISFAFDDTTRAPEMSGGGPEAAALAAKMSEAWISFARSGDPNTPQLPEWPPYRLPQRATIVFDNECAVVEDPEPEVRRLWASV